MRENRTFDGNFLSTVAESLLNEIRLLIQIHCYSKQLLRSYLKKETSSTTNIVTSSALSNGVKEPVEYYSVDCMHGGSAVRMLDRFYT